IGGWHHVVCWRPSEKEGELHGLQFRGAGATLIGKPHARLPLLFAAGYNADSLLSVGQVEGYLTLLPRQYVIPGAKLLSPPAVMSKTNTIAVGGDHYVYLLRLDGEGRPLPEVIAA